MIAGSIAVLSVSAAAVAAPIDFTTMSQSYWTLPPGDPGASYVNGVEPGWTINAASALLTLSKDSSPEISGGPHVQTSLSGVNDFVATVTADAGSNTSIGNFFLDTGSGFAGLSFSDSFVGASYYLPGVPGSGVGASISGPLTLELARTGDTFTASYSTGGAFTVLYSLTNTGLLGDPSFDLTTYSPVGSTATELLTYSNFDVTSVPEPAAWAMMLGGFGLAGAALRRRQTYRLVEIAAGGATSSETFSADDDQSALAQALEVAEGVAIEVWKGEALVARYDLADAAAA